MSVEASQTGGAVGEARAARAPKPLDWVIGLAFLLALGTFVVYEVRTSSPGKLLGWGLTTALLLGVGVLAVRYPAFDRAMRRGFNAYMRFAFWAFALLLPIVAFRWVFAAVTWRLPLWAQIPAFVLLGALLAWAILQIATKARRERFFQAAGRAGGFAPLIYIVNVVMIAAMFFASVAFILVRNGVVAVGVQGTDQVLFGKLLDFFTWQFLKLIPLVDVTETLKWQAPLAYDAGAFAFVVLLFRVAVIVPAIGAFAGYFEQRAALRGSAPAPP